MTAPLMTKMTYYISLIEKVDVFCTRVKTECSDSVVCRRGCDSCCRHLTLFPVEAVHLRLAMISSPQDVRQIIQGKALSFTHASEGPCPLLHEGGCLLYHARPLICRTHGYPILVDDGDSKRVDHCPLNFTSGKIIERHHILDLDTLNTTLTAINTLFVNEYPAGRTFPDRILMAEALVMDMMDDMPIGIKFKS